MAGEDGCSKTYTPGDGNIEKVSDVDTDDGHELFFHSELVW
jgi:hypothetical protein